MLWTVVDRGKAEAVETTVFPWTALDTRQQYVRVDLSVEISAEYPDASPTVTLRNPRGLDDTVLDNIKAQIRDKCDDFLGQPVIYEIINVSLLLVEGDRSCFEWD